MFSDFDRSLVDAIRDGDAKAYELLFKTYYSRLCKYANGFVHDDAMAEDMVMDVFIKIWESQEQLLINTSINAYLFRSVHNRCLNFLTRTRRRFNDLDDETIEKLNNLVPQETPNSPSAAYNTTELLREIGAAIEKLPEECRRIFIMSRTEELSHKEIAEKLNLSENTVKVQIYRALIKLREYLKDFLPLLLLCLSNFY